MQSVRVTEKYVTGTLKEAAPDDGKRFVSARNIVTRFGMYDKLGLVTYETPRQTFLAENAFAHYAEREFSEDTAREIDCAVRELTTGAFEMKRKLLRAQTCLCSKMSGRQSRQLSLSHDGRKSDTVTKKFWSRRLRPYFL